MNFLLLPSSKEPMKQRLADQRVAGSADQLLIMVLISRSKLLGTYRLTDGTRG